MLYKFSLRWKSIEYDLNKKMDGSSKPRVITAIATTLINLFFILNQLSRNRLRMIQKDPQTTLGNLNVATVPVG